MARGDSGITALSLRRLYLFKELQDISNTANFLGIHATADAAAQLAIPRTIDGIPFNGTQNITLPTKIVRLWYTDSSGTRTWYTDSAKTQAISSFDTNKLYINMQDAVLMYYNGTGFTNATAPTLTTTRKVNGINFNGSVDISNYCVSSTAGNVAAKTATLSGFNKVSGASVFIKFANTNTVNNITLNINSSGAAPVTFNNDPVTAGDIVANIIYHLIYDGTNYAIAGTSKIAYTEFLPSTDYSAGLHGLVPPPAIGDDEEMYLTANCTWKIPSNYHKTSHTYAIGEIVHVSAFPSNYELQCVTAGTTATTRAAIDNYLNQ